jgi:hypothetical protein
MDPRVSPLLDTLKLNTRLALNCLDGLTESQALERPAGVNSAAFVAAHLADSRHFLLRVLGAPAENPLARYLDGKRSIDDITELPGLDTIRDAWRSTAPLLEARLGAMTAAELAAPSGIRFPIDDRSVLGVLVFLVQHDGYHIGQLSLLRRMHGLPAMKYT